MRETGVKSKRIRTTRRESKELIALKAAQLFREKGYNNITVEQIAKALNLSKVSIYFHWESKLDLLYEIHKISHKALLKRLLDIVIMKEPPDVKLYLAIKNHIEHVCAERSPATMAFQQDLALLGNRRRTTIIKMRDQYDTLLRKIIMDGIKLGIFIECDSKLISFSIEGAANYTQQWYSSGGPLVKAKIIDQMSTYLIRGILANLNKDNNYIQSMTKPKTL